MRFSLRHFTYLLILGSLMVILISACKTVTNTNIARYRQPIENCRMVEHPLGRTCIPHNPQRIISESTFLDPLFALGVQKSIVGTNCYSMQWAVKGCSVSGLTSDQLENIETVGYYPPSLEKILLLKPELILWSEHIRPIYHHLAGVAPTVTIHWEDLQYSFKEYLRHFAKIFDREEVAEEILARYQDQISAVRKQLDNRLVNAEVSVIIYGCAGSNAFSIPPKYAIWFQILDDLGVKIKPIFSMTQKSWCSTFNSLETINNYDSDILFIANFHSKSGSSLLNNPLISSLNAAKNKRAYVVDGQDIWDVYGPQGVSKLLDLLSKYLLEAAQTF